MMIDMSSDFWKDWEMHGAVFLVYSSGAEPVCRVSVDVRSVQTLHSSSQFSMLSHDPCPSWETSSAPWVKQLLVEETLKHKSTQIQNAKLTTSDNTCWYHKDIFDFLSILGMISRRNSTFGLHVFWVYNSVYLYIIWDLPHQLRVPKWSFNESLYENPEAVSVVTVKADLKTCFFL